MQREPRDARPAGHPLPRTHLGRHARAVSDLIGSKRHRLAPGQSLRDEINAHPGTAVVSMEYLGPIRAPRIEQVKATSPTPSCGSSSPFATSAAPSPPCGRRRSRTAAPGPGRSTSTTSSTVATAGRSSGASSPPAGSSSAGRRGRGRPRHGHHRPPPGAPSGAALAALLPGRRHRARRLGGGATRQRVPRRSSALLMRRLNVAPPISPSRPTRSASRRSASTCWSIGSRDEDPIGFTVPRWLRRKSRRWTADLRERRPGRRRPRRARARRHARPSPRASFPAELDSAVAALSTVLRNGKPNWAQKAVRKAKARIGA